MDLIIGTGLLIAAAAIGAAGPASAPELRMDSIDWVVFAIAAVAIPFSAWAHVRWWQKARTTTIRKDWQSLGMILTGLVCMICIVCWYLFKFILRGRI